MKKIILFALALVVTTAAVAKQRVEKEPIKVDFYGVDFSRVNVVGSVDSDAKLMAAFDGINNLLVSEANKYNVGRFLNLDVLSLQIDNAIDQRATLSDVKFKDRGAATISLEEVIKPYPSSENNILLIVAKELNKRENRGSFVAVIYDGQTKQIISVEELKGKSKGFGLRNFWAGALYDGLKAAKK